MAPFNPTKSQVFFQDVQTGKYFGVTKEEYNRIKAICSQYNFDCFLVPEELLARAYPFEIVDGSKYVEGEKAEKLPINRIKWIDVESPVKQ